jgi:DnaJ-class molecular chaperone
MTEPKLPCRNCGGDGTVIETYHVGENVETVVEQCGLCGGKGYELGELVTCEDCDGTGTAPHTFGELPCNRCHGKGTVEQYNF